MRVSYNDYKLYLSILESVSKQLNRAIKSEVSLNSEDDIPDHDFDGKRDTVYLCTSAPEVRVRKYIFQPHNFVFYSANCWISFLIYFNITKDNPP